MATTGVITSTTDRRSVEPHRKQTWEVVARATWASGDTAAVTITVPNVNGILGSMTVKNSNATNPITVSASLTDELGGVYPNFTAIAENSSAVKTSSTDFDAVPINGDYTLTITPSGDPGASGLTVDVSLKGV